MKSASMSRYISRFEISIRQIAWLTVNVLVADFWLDVCDILYYLRNRSSWGSTARIYNE